MIDSNVLRLSAMTLAVLMAGAAFAQTPPDAGQILQDSLGRPLQPLAPSVDFQPQAAPLTDTPSGGAEMVLDRVVLSGNSVFTTDELMQVLGDVQGRSYDLAGLRALANRISLFYREQGYTFARAVLPAQRLTDGELKIDVIEGRYGEVSATGDDQLAQGAQKFLSNLQPGNVIESTELSRSMLLLGDLPGVKVAPVLRPGAEAGTGDLDVQVSADKRVKGVIGVDNHGNRYSGEHRANLALEVNRLLVLGDTLSIRGLYSNEDTVLGQIGYSLPLGGSGLRGNVSYAHTNYSLRAPFSDNTGTADITSLGLSYPLLRSQRSNMVLSVAYQHKDLDNEFDDFTYESKTLHNLPITLQFDHRDELWGGGVTYGNLVLTPGRLEFDDRIANSSEKEGFTKSNLHLARIQRITPDFSLFASLAGQWADQSLDSAEAMNLGGALGVRAYPQGEGLGSRGWIGQLEARYNATNWLTPYVFYDAGQIRAFEDEDKRNLSGAGVGIRMNYAQLSFDLNSAWKLDGGDAVSDDKQRNPRIWFTTSYTF